MSTFRILVADDHPVFRLGLCSLIDSHEGWAVCGKASDGREAIEMCKQLKPDLLTLDICMPNLNGVDAARRIIKSDPAQRILIVTDVNSEQVIRDCLKAGIRGWVFKSDGIDDLTIAMEELQRRKTAFNAEVSHLVLEGYLRQQAHLTAPDLSIREREVLQLISDGKGNKEISTTLHVSINTTEAHRSNLMRKLKLHSVAELVLYAVRNKIVHVGFPHGLRFPDPKTNGANRHSADC